MRTNCGQRWMSRRPKGLPRYDVLQPEYNLYDRKSSTATCAISAWPKILASSPISGSPGASSPANTAAKPISAKARAATGSRIISTRAVIGILAALDAVSAKHKAKQAEVALAWIIQRKGVTAPIASATSLEQLESLIKAASLELDKDDIAELDKASA